VEQRGGNYLQITRQIIKADVYGLGSRVRKKKRSTERYDSDLQLMSMKIELNGEGKLVWVTRGINSLKERKSEREYVAG